MTKTTTDKSRRPRSVLAWVLIASVGLHAVTLLVLWQTDFLDSRMVIDREAEEKRAAEVAERERARKELERQEREKIKLPEEAREELKREVEQKEQRKIAKRIDEILKNREEVLAIRDRKLQDIEKRNTEEMFREQMEQIREEMAELKQTTERLNGVVEQVVPRGDPELAAASMKAAELEQKMDEIAEKIGEEGENAEVAEELAAAARELYKMAASVREQHDQLPPAGPARHTTLQATAQARDVAEKSAKLAEKLAETGFNDTSEAVELASVDPDQFQEMSTAELYDKAVELEGEVAEAYVDVRAAELALMQQETFANSKEKIAHQDVQRPDLAQQLSDPQLQDVGQLNEYRETLAEAGRQTEQMQLRTASLARQANVLDRGEGAQAERASQLASAIARASRDGRSQNMASLMRAMSGSSDGGAGDDTSTRQETGGEGMQHVDRQRTEIQLELNRVVAQALPGRKFDSDSPRQGWLYIDTWYVIGPFENNGKVDWTQTNPPDTEVDFDAVYSGKNDLPVRWEFTQADQILLTPPNERSNSTYYAYTEVYFDQPQEMLISIASDDAARLTINDLPVWEEEGLSQWRLGEGTRRVFFKQGYNIIKARIENGPNVCKWTVLMCPPDAQ